MWTRKGRTSHGPIGCAISARGVGLAQHLDRSGQRALRLAWQPLATPSQVGAPTEANIAEKLRCCLSSGSFQGNQVTLSIPSERVHFFRVQLPPTNGCNPRELVRERVIRDWALDDDAIRIDYYEIPRSPAAKSLGLDCIAVAANATDVERYARIVREAGLEPAGVETSAGAIARCIRDCSSPTHGPLLVVELGERANTLTIVRGGVPALVCPARQVSPTPGVPGAAGAGLPRDNNRGTEQEPSTARLASDIIADAQILMQYLAEAGLEHLVPAEGALIGAGALGSALLSNIERERSAPPFVAFESVLTPIVLSARAGLPTGVDLDELLASIGSACIGQEEVALEAAA